jgi:transglutaminase-like putative cysteine protease
MKRTRFARLDRLPALLLLLVAGAISGAEHPQTAQEAAPAVDCWSTYSIGGQAVGYIREAMWTRDAGGATTRVQVLVIINRLGNKVEIAADTSYEEGSDGRLRSVRSEMSSSKQKTLVEADIVAGQVALRVRAGDREYKRMLDVAGVVLGPEAANRLLAAKLKAAGDAADYQTFSPEMQKVIKISWRAIGAETIDLSGRKLAAIKAEQIIEGYPAKRTVWIDGEGRTLRANEPGPFGATEVARTDRATALAAASAGELRGEMYDRTLVRANIRLPQPRSIRRIQLQLMQKDKSLGWPEFEGPGQRVIRQEPGSILLEICQPDRQPPARRPATETPSMRDYLMPNAILQSDDAEVRRIAREVVGSDTDVAASALRLRDWVHRNMQFDAGIAVAPSSEVARNRRGTCAAYAVLLASLLRAEGIPARVVMGSVYVAGAWGGHAWVEYRAGDSWLPLDAALPSAGVSDAARLACFRSSLRDGIGPHLGSLLQLYGNVDIRVTEYEVNGKTTRVADGARPYVVDGDTYRNPWLGVAVTKPAGFRFGKMDAVYPETSVLELLGPRGEIVHISLCDLGPAADSAAAARDRLRDSKLEGPERRQRIAGREAVVIANARRAGLALVEGADVWVLTVEGDDAPRLLEDVAGRLQFLP